MSLAKFQIEFKLKLTRNDMKLFFKKQLACAPKIVDIIFKTNYKSAENIL